MRAEAPEGGRDNELRLVLWAALILSLGGHLVIYFSLNPWWPGPVGSPSEPNWMTMVEGPGDGMGEEVTPEESGEAGSDLLESEPIAPQERVPEDIRVQRETEPELVEEQITVVDEAEEPDVAVEDPIERIENTQAPSNEVRDIPSPEETANRLFVDALINRGNNGQGNVGAGTGSGGGGEAGGGGECGDPILGTWRARRYDRLHQRHATFTIRVTHREGDRLEGTIINRAWSGGPLQTSPPRCTPGVFDHTVRMPAHGRFNGREFRMDAESHRRTVHCIDTGIWMYNLDHFSGRMQGDVLVTVNNDGGVEVNSPYRFRRVSCL